MGGEHSDAAAGAAVVKMPRPASPTERDTVRLSDWLRECFQELAQLFRVSRLDEPQEKTGLFPSPTVLLPGQTGHRNQHDVWLLL